MKGGGEQPEKKASGIPCTMDWFEYQESKAHIPLGSADD
jgi:hypothetical protein